MAKAPKLTSTPVFLFYSPALKTHGDCTAQVIMCRKGFIKLALESGADVVPVYLFGNTAVLQVFKHPVLVQLSRALGASLTLFWGRWGLPLPMPDRLVYVRGPPLGLPKVRRTRVRARRRLRAAHPTPPALLSFARVRTWARRPIIASKTALQIVRSQHKFIWRTRQCCGFTCARVAQ
jgi:hypothetical protein